MLLMLWPICSERSRLYFEIWKDGAEPNKKDSNKVRTPFKTNFDQSSEENVVAQNQTQIHNNTSIASIDEANDQDEPEISDD